MSIKDFDALWDVSLDTLRENSIQPFLEKDTKYLEDEEESGKAEAKYLGLQLSKAQEDIVEHYLMCKERLQGYYAHYSYMAGIKDGMKALQKLQLAR